MDYAHNSLKLNYYYCSMSAYTYSTVPSVGHLAAVNEIKCWPESATLILELMRKEI